MLTQMLLKLQQTASKLSKHLLNKQKQMMMILSPSTSPQQNTHLKMISSICAESGETRILERKEEQYTIKSRNTVTDKCYIKNHRILKVGKDI